MFHLELLVNGQWKLDFAGSEQNCRHLAQFLTGVMFRIIKVVYYSENIRAAFAPVEPQKD